MNISFIKKISLRMGALAAIIGTCLCLSGYQFFTWLNPKNHWGAPAASLPKDWINVKGPADPAAKKILAEAEALRHVELLVPADLITPIKNGQ
jgi:hypothetical protein